LGLGCYRAARPPDITRFGVNLLLLVALISNPTRIEALDLKGVTLLLSGFADSPIWKRDVGRLGRCEWWRDWR